MNQPDPQHSQPSLSLLLSLAGGFLGIILSYGALAGDAQGQVNLLFLLLVFVFLPVIALMLSLGFLLRPGGRGLIGWLLELPIWSVKTRAAFFQAHSLGSRKAWLVYQTQLFGLGFSLGCLLLYLLLLVATDISFVWRSTLLEAEQLLPVLNVIALPWWFWPDAQASLPLIEQTRDFRLTDTEQGAALVGLWWRFILAAQITYSLMPRTLMLVIARRLVGRRTPREQDHSTAAAAASAAPSAVELAPVQHSVALPYLLLDWAAAPDHCVRHLQERLGRAELVKPVSAAASAAGMLDGRESHSVLVLVKGWEPPLGEQADFMKGLGAGAERLLLPLDWDERGMKPLATQHVQEWRRFASTLGGWKVLQLKEET